MNAARNCPKFFAIEAPSKGKGLASGHRFDGRLSYSASEFALDDRPVYSDCTTQNLGVAKFVEECGVNIIQNSIN